MRTSAQAEPVGAVERSSPLRGRPALYPLCLQC